MSGLRRIRIDGEVVEVAADLTLLQACEQAGREIPRFCYHERLSIAGNCRMCLVEVVGGPKPVASCAMQVKDLRPGPEGAAPEIHTRSASVRTAREGVMEFLLINHPLDCPICDQGGECDLQDQAMAYGGGASRFREGKRAQPAIDLGPLVKTEMNRCIHCTRCVRFLTEVAGVPELGLLGRGEEAAILPYLDRSLTSELQGNIIDLCPVGALTSRPYAFTARPWELQPVESIDVMDALGSAIRIDARGREVMRILPRNHDGLNEEWIADRTRFVWDGLGRRRLDRPWLRDADGRRQAVSWATALAATAERLAAAGPARIGAVAGELAPVEAQWALLRLLDSLAVPHRDCRQNGAALEAGNPCSWRFNSQVAGIDRADAILLVGSDPRRECPVLNARLRRAWLGGTRIGGIGPETDSTYPVERLGDGPAALAGLADTPFGAALAAAARPLIILGQAALARPDGAAVLDRAMALAERVGAVGVEAAGEGEGEGEEGKEDPDAAWCGFSVLQTAAGVTGGLEIGFLPGAGGLDTAGMLAAGRAGQLDVLFLLGADELDLTGLDGVFVVYLGSHGDAGAASADVILPGAAWTEQSGLFVNLEGRPQVAAAAVAPPGEAREDWRVLRALSGALDRVLPFDSLTALRAGLFAAHPHLGRLGAPPAAAWQRRPAADLPPLAAAPFAAFPAGGTDGAYAGNPVARASRVLADLARRRNGAAAG